jgi:hypothetical protein
LAGYTLHFLGDQTGARRLIEHMLANYPGSSRKTHTYRFQFDQPVTARITLAWVLWLQGFPDQALESTKRNIQDAIQIDHPLSLGNALAKSACPIALLTGDLGLARNLIALFAEHTRPEAIAIWQPLSRCFEGLLAIAQGETGAGLETVMAALDRSHMGRFTLPYSWVIGELALTQAKHGQVSLGMQTIVKAIARAEQDDERWCFAELLRIRGEIVLCQDSSGSAEQAERDFLQSSNWRAINTFSHGSCAPLQVLHVSCITKVDQRMRRICFVQFMTVSRRASRQQTSWRPVLCLRILVVRHPNQFEVGSEGGRDNA